MLLYNIIKHIKPYQLTIWGWDGIFQGEKIMNLYLSEIFLGFL